MEQQFDEKNSFQKQVRQELGDAGGPLSSVKVTVVYFAQAREFAETAEEEFVLTSPVYVEQLLSAIMKTHPKLSRIRQIIRTMANGRPVVESDELKNGDRVALLPPVAGG